MQPINAISFAPGAGAWLANFHHARVLHVFDRACNLVDERRELLSIVTQRIGDGPFNLVIRDEGPLSDRIDARSAISFCAGQLDVGGLSINICDARSWAPRPDWAGLHARKYDLLDRVRALRLPPGVSLLPGAAVRDLSNAFAAADVSAGLNAARQLAGLGNGLTPAGDDFILGAVLAVWIVHPPDIAGGLAEAIAGAAAPLTASLSAAWLRAAGRGEAGILWHLFFDALISGGEAALGKSVAALLAVGHTSGADALAGFVSVLFTFSKIGQTHVIPE